MRLDEGQWVVIGLLRSRSPPVLPVNAARLLPVLLWVSEEA